MIYQMGEIEYRFAEIIWKNEPVPSNVLVRLSLQELGWKKSTMYTVLHRLCQKGIFVNENGIVSSLISKEEWQKKKGERFIDEAYGGSIPAFLAAFLSPGKLSEEEAKELHLLIDKYQTGEK